MDNCLMKTDEIITCNKCGQVLVSGRGIIAIFGKGTSIECRKCGNKYVFGEANILTNESDEIRNRNRK